MQCLFTGLSLFFIVKFLVATGCGPKGYIQKIEVLHLPDSDSDILNQYIPARHGAISAVINNKPIICGGNYYSEYFEDGFVLAQPQKKFKLTEKRADAASLLLNKNTLWVVGGESDLHVPLKTTEFIKFQEETFHVTKGPNLPFSIRWIS